MIDHEYVIQTEELFTAKTRIDLAIAVVGDVPSLLQAAEEVAEAYGAIEDLETFEDRVSEAIRHADRALELVDDYRTHLAEQHRRGMVRLSNEAVIGVDRALEDARTALADWSDWARRELDEISG